MTVLAFSGPDGSGKSTQINLLERELQASGKHPVVIWFRPGYSDRVDAIRDFLRRRSGNVIPQTGDTEHRERTMQRKPIRFLWHTIASADTLLEYCAMARRGTSDSPRIYDRWAEDAVLDLSISFPERRRTNELLAWTLARFAAKPHRHFVFCIPLAEAERRRKQKDEPFPDAPGVAEIRHKDYSRMACLPRTTAIDAAGPEERVFAEIWLEVVDEDAQ